MFRPLAPVYSLNLEALRRAGRFAQPDEGEGGDKATDPPKPDDPAKPEGDKPTDPAGRITALVDERNAERNKTIALQKKYDALQAQVEQLRGGEQAVADLQKQLEDTRTATATRFDKLLELELTNLPDAAANAVKAIPGGSEVQFDWLVANRALFQAAGESEKKGVDGPKNEKKPAPGADPGASSVAKGYVESRKPAKSGFPGLTG